MPVDKFSMKEISDFGEKWFREGDRKMDLNFACSTDSEIDIDILKNIFDPKKFLVKLTPINETFSSKENDLVSLFYHCLNMITIQLPKILPRI
jgi:23S rRNA (adenine2503-C2)-methyltransferase